MVALGLPFRFSRGLDNKTSETSTLKPSSTSTWENRVPVQYCQCVHTAQLLFGVPTLQIHTPSLSLFSENYLSIVLITFLHECNAGWQSGRVEQVQVCIPRASVPSLLEEKGEATTAATKVGACETFQELRTCSSLGLYLHGDGYTTRGTCNLILYTEQETYSDNL